MTRQSILEISTSGRGTRNVTDAVAKVVTASRAQRRSVVVTVLGD